MKTFRRFLTLSILCALSAFTMHVWGDTYSLTPNQSSTGSAATTYITTLTEFTYSGITWKMNQWNPNSLQIKTNQNSAASEFRFYNTTAFPGKITKVVLKFSALTLSNTTTTGFMFVGGSSAVTATTGGTNGVWNSTNKTITWTPGSSDNFTYFAFYQNGKVATGTNKLATADAIVVTYESSSSTVATPTFSPAEGSYSSTQSVTISCGTSGATIYYTTNGSTPTTSSSTYSGAISVSSTTTIKAMAVKSGMTNSAVATATYTINVSSCSYDLTTASYASGASTATVTWDSNASATMTIEKNTSSTNANNYIPPTYSSTRFYTNQILTITPKSGKTLSSIVFTAKSDNYANALYNSTWTNATASVSGSTVTITPTDISSAVSATIGANCGFSCVEFTEGGAATFSVTYNGNDNTSGSVPTDGNSYSSGSTVTVKGNTNSLVKTGYSALTHWNTAADGSGTNYAISSTFSILSNTTLYAKWTATITLNNNGATTSGSTSATVNYKSSTVSAITNPVKTDKVFAGWYSGSGGTGDLVINSNGQLQSNVSGFTDADGKWVATAEKTLYAKWTTATVYTLLSNAANLYDGDEIVIVSHYEVSDTYYALSNHQKTNNREAISTGFSLSGSTLTVEGGSNVQPIVVEKSNTDWLFNVGTNAYLYAASNTENHLKTSTLSTVGNNGKWSISVSSDIASIEAQGSNSHKVLRFNYNGGGGKELFSCYTTDKYTDYRAVQIYHIPISGPTIMATASFKEFTYVRGQGPSAAQTFTVRGALLTNNVTITAPTDYEVCLTKDGTYASSVTLNTGSGTLSATTVYIRLAANKAVGEYDGNITLTSSGATTKTIAVEGSVTCVTPVLSFASPILTKYANAANFTNALTITGVDPSDVTVTYSSSDPTKASVDPSTGEVDIKAVTTDGTPVVITASTGAVGGANCISAASASYNIVIGHKITWYVNTQEYTEGSPTLAVADGGSIIELPTPPDGTATCGNKVFVGWTANSSYSSTTSPPNDMFASAGGAPSPITTNKEFYAVFANESGDPTSFTRITNSADWHEGQRIVIVANNNSKMLANDWTGGAAPSETGGKITVTDSKYVWTIGENDGNDWYQLYSGDIVLSAAGAVSSSQKFQYVEEWTEDNSYYSWWTIDDELSTTNCFGILNDWGDADDGNNTTEWISYLEWYNTGGKWETYYVDNFSTETNFAMRLYKSDVTYSNYSVTCATPWIVTVNSSGHGSVTASPIYVANGTSTTLTLTPDAGYQCSDVILNEGNATEGTLSNCSYTLTNITSDVDLTAKFSKLPVYHVIFDAGDGKVVGANAHTVTLAETTRTFGVTVPYATSCADDWKFAYWSTANPTTETTTAPVNTADPGQKYVPDEDNVTLYAIYTKTTGTASYTTGTDQLTRALIGVTGTEYIDWSDISASNSGHTAAVYAGNSAGKYTNKDVTVESLQLRAKNNSGIVSTTSGGILSEVKITWDSHTATDKRSIDVYGYNTAYASTSDIYGSSPKGIKLGTLTYDGTAINKLTLTPDNYKYKYVGLRPKGGAMYLTQVDIEWVTKVEGLTIKYCTKPTCDECNEPTHSFALPTVTLSYPHADPYTNTFNSNNTNTKTFSSSNTSVATVNSSGVVSILGTGNTVISVHQDKMTSGAKYCAVDDSYTLTVKEASVDVVEVTNSNEIIVEHDLGANTSALIDQLVLHEEGNKADEVFFSKYFEATGNVKLVALYNGTGKPHDPSKYRIRCASTSASVQHIVKVGDYVDKWPNGKELIFYSWNTTASSDLAVMACVYGKNDNGEINMSEWIPIPWETYSGTRPAIIFGGDAAIVLEEYDGSQWNILDIIGALTADGKKADNSNLVNTSVITWGDGTNKGWYCANGRELNGSDTDYALSTLRCLLVRKFDILSGKAARNTTTGNLGTGNFNTLCTEWYGKQVTGTTREENNASACESFSEVGNFDYYDAYQKYEELNTNAFSATNNDDGTMTITINPEIVSGGLAGLSCNYLKIKVTTNEVNPSDRDVLAEVEYKVPIIVTGDKQTDDAIFDFEDCSICDVAILQGGSLTTVAAGKNIVNDLEVYRGAKLSVPAEQEYTINDFIMRSKGDLVPQADIVGTLNRANTKLYFDKRVDENQWYWMTLPYDCNRSDVTLRNGETPSYGIGEDWALQIYDGRKRANTQSGGCWQLFEEDIIQKGVGYILGVTPKTGHAFVELRFPMTATAWDKDDARSTISVPVMGTKGESDGVPVNDRGWNLVGNPYLTNYSKGKIGNTTAGTDATNIIPQGLLVEVIGNGYHYDGNVRYVNVPVDGGYSEYNQIAIGAQPLPPFMSYFIQIDGSDGEPSYVQFSNTLDQQSYAPIRRTAQEYTAEDNRIIWLPFDLTNSNGESDETTLLISNRFSDGYDMMDDLIKWRGDYYQYDFITTKPVIATRNSEGEMAFNALPDASAAAGIPVNFYAAYSGEYTISLNGKYGLDDVEEVLLWDASTKEYYNLLTDDYTFTNTKGNNTNRFKLFVTVNRKSPQITTDIDNLQPDSKLNLIAIDKTLVLSGISNGSEIFAYDMSGQLVSKSSAVCNGIWRTTVPTSGVYFVRVNSVDGQQTLRTIVY